jgi:prevent-host-death family protein
MIWALQDAKNKFSELVDKAVGDGPQTVTRHGREAVVVMSVNDYKKLLVNKKDLVEFFSSSPLVESGLDFDRSIDSHHRGIEF